MSFKITRSVGFIGIFASLIWLLIRVSNPIETECRVDYYGTPDFHTLADDILNLQIASYHNDYNYHRVLNTENYTKENVDMASGIHYFGGEVFNNDISHGEALRKIQDHIERIYENDGLAELRVYWTIPIYEMMGMGYPSAEFEITSEKECIATLEVSNELGYEIGELITCYVPSLKSQCEVSFEPQTNLDGTVAFLAYVVLFCFITVTTVVSIAVSARCWKRFRKEI